MKRDILSILFSACHAVLMVWRRHWQPDLGANNDSAEAEAPLYEPTGFVVQPCVSRLAYWPGPDTACDRDRV